MKLETQKFIEAHGLAMLVERYHIAAKRHPRYPNLVFLKYDQIESPMAEPICQECRGLILDEADGWRVVSYPFRKFFNYGEGHAPAIDWRTARVYEKLDGSLMTLYWYDGAWQVASNGTPDAGGDVWGHSGTFAHLFWQVWYRQWYWTPSDQSLCYMFELMTPHNRVVVPHSASRLVCIGARDVRDGREVRPEDLGRTYGWEFVKSYPFYSIDDCLAAARALNPMQSEGYVVCDASFNRVKVKSPQYVALSHMKDSFSARRMLEIVRLNESDEFLTYFPEMRPTYEAVRYAFDGLVAEIEGTYARIRGIDEQKTFAIEAQQCRLSSALFMLRAGKVASVREYLAKATVQSLERAIGMDAIVRSLAAAPPATSAA